MRVITALHARYVTKADALAMAGRLNRTTGKGYDVRFDGLSTAKPWRVFEVDAPRFETGTVTDKS